MRKFIFIAMVIISIGAYGQDALPAPSKPDPLSGFELNENVSISKSGVRYSGKTYTEIYDVVTDSVVYRFGMEFKYDSTFIKRVPMDSCDRKVYDMMNRTTEKVLSEQESNRKETIEFLNRYRTSYEVWLYFKLLGIIRK